MLNWFMPYFNIYLGGGNIGRSTERKLAKQKNNFVWQNIFAQLVTDALDRYKLEGLPETISERVFLQSLLWYGSVAIFEKDGGIMALPCVPSGAGFNVYGDPAEGWLFSCIGQLNEKADLYLPGSDENAFLLRTNGINSKANAHGVFIRANAICYPFINHVLFYSDAIADTMRTLDICRANIKKPYIVVAEESVVPTVKEFFKKRDNNEEYIISSGIFPADKINILPFAVNSDNLKDTTALIDWYFSQFKTLCGIESNNNIDKKGENLISDEIHIDEEYTESEIDKDLRYIQEGLDNANKIFGTNIRIKKTHEQPEYNIENNEKGENNNVKDI